MHKDPVIGTQASGACCFITIVIEPEPESEVPDKHPASPKRKFNHFHPSTLHYVPRASDSTQIKKPKATRDLINKPLSFRSPFALAPSASAHENVYNCQTPFDA